MSFVAFDGQNFIRCFTATFTYHRLQGVVPLTIFFGQFFKCPLDDCAFSVGHFDIDGRTIFHFLAVHWCCRLALRVRGLNLAKRVGVGAGNGASRNGGRGKGRAYGTQREGQGGRETPGSGGVVAEGIIRVVLGVGDSPCRCGV